MFSAIVDIWGARTVSVEVQQLFTRRPAHDLRLPHPIPEVTAEVCVAHLSRERENLGDSCVGSLQRDKRMLPIPGMEVTSHRKMDLRSMTLPATAGTPIAVK